MHVNLPVTTENMQNVHNRKGSANLNGNYSFIEPMDEKSAANFDQMYISRGLDRIDYTTIHDQNNLS